MNELSNRLTVREFYNWETFSILEPFVSDRVDLSGALVASVLSNINRGKGQKTFEISDFMIVQNSLGKKVAADNDAAEDAHFMITMASFGGVSQ